MNVRLDGVQASGGFASGSRLLGPSRASSHAIAFGPSALGAASQHVTASFAVSGSRGNSTPTVSAHFGHDYSFGPLQCSGAGATQSCSMEVTFTPTLPGAREDALFLSDGGTRLATILLHGVGQSPLSLMQPQVAGPWGNSGADSSSVVDENGTLFTLDRASGSVTSISAAGVATRLPITGLSVVRSLQLDGAGVLYLLGSGSEQSLTTFDTVQGTQGLLALPVAASLVDAATLDPAGNLFAFSGKSHMLYKIDADRKVTATSSDVGLSRTISAMVLAANGELLAGGSSLYRIARSGLPSATSATDALTPLSIDAAGTLYARSGSALLQLAGPDYALASKLPFADAVGNDGSLYLTGLSGYVRTDRSETLLDFGDVAPSAASEARFATIYNAGNLPLTLSNLELAGLDFALSATVADSCAAGADLAPGASCRLGVALVASHSGTSRGTISVVSNSLNTPATSQTVGLIAHATVPSQAVLTPTTLPFSSTIVNTVNATQMTSVLSNPGTAALNLASIGLTGAGSGSYTLTQNCFTSVPAVLAAGASCTLTVSFKPLSASAQAATISVVDDAGGTAGSIQTVTLTGLGIATPAPVINFVPTSLTFGLTGSPSIPSTAVIIGTSSAPQTINIVNNGNAIANVSNLALTTTGVSLQYSFSTTCGSTIAIGGSCAVTIIFSPTTGGVTPTTTLSITDNAAFSPQSAAINGTGTQGNYTVTTPTTTITIPASGGSGSMVLTATPAPAPFPTPVVFTPFGLPGGATYAFAPAAIFPMTAPATTTFTVTIPPYHPSTLAQFSDSLPGRRPYVPVMAVMVAGLCFGLRRRTSLRQTRLFHILLLAALGIGLTSISGCFGGVTVGGGVPPGTYALTITAQSANGVDNSVVFPTQHFINVNLIVQ